MTGRLALAAALYITVAGTIVPHAQSHSVAIQVTDAAGIRRTEYPVSAQVPFAKASLADDEHAALRLDGNDVPAQYSVGSRWDDGSVRTLDVDFNASVGPNESRAYQLEYGADVHRPASVPRGLTFADEGDAIRVGNWTFSRTAVPLVRSANFRGEFIASGPGAANAVSIVDDAGARHELSAAQLEIVKRGPLLATLRYSGRVAIDSTTDLPFTMTIDTPNSKSWVRTAVVVEDPAKRVRDIALDTPLALGDAPWTWDFGTDSGTYGALRTATDAVLLTATINPTASRWTVDTGTDGDLRPYERSTTRPAKAFRGWGHIVGPSRAVAFAVDRLGAAQGTYEIAINGRGQARFQFAPAQPQPELRLTVYEHFVSTPVPIGAATSATSMLNPPRVRVEADRKAPIGD